MFRKTDFKKVDLLGSGKKNTKIYKAEHLPTGKIYAIKEVEAKTLEKLNEYKVRLLSLICAGRGRATLQGTVTSDGAPVLRLLLL
jgi:serine/threonine protein kinase